MDLVTHGFSTELDQMFRTNLVDNFLKIQNAINNLPDYTEPIEHNVELIKQNKQLIIQNTKLIEKNLKLIDKLSYNLKITTDILRTYDVPIGIDQDGNVIDYSKEVEKWQ